MEKIHTEQIELKSSHDFEGKVNAISKNCLLNDMNYEKTNNLISNLIEEQKKPPKHNEGNVGSTKT